MKFKLGCTALIVLSVAGALWSVRPGAGPVASLLAPVFGIMIFLELYALAVNAYRIVDWFRVRTPPIVQDPVLGALTYNDGVWSSPDDGRPVFWLEGRRTGPDPELVRAGSEAMTRIAALEAVARAFVAADPRPESLGRLGGLNPRPMTVGGERVIEIALEFEIPGDLDVVDVFMLGDTATRFDRH